MDRDELLRVATAICAARRVDDETLVEAATRSVAKAQELIKAVDRAVKSQPRFFSPDECSKLRTDYSLEDGPIVSDIPHMGVQS